MEASYDLKGHILMELITLFGRKNCEILKDTVKREEIYEDLSSASKSFDILKKKEMRDLL